MLRPAGAGRFADCEGALTGGVRSRFFASASNSEPNYRVTTQVFPRPWNKRSEIEASCSDLSPPTEQTTPFTMADGTDVDMDATSTALSFDFERETGGLRNPAGALLNGRSFRINTGVKVSEETTCTGACSGKVKITERYIAIFTARRP